MQKRNMENVKPPRNFCSRISQSDVLQDVRHHLVWWPGQNITKQYKVIYNLGEGSFGKVFKAFDSYRFRPVALKVVKKVPKFFNAAQQEIDILKKLNDLDKTGQYHVVKMLDWLDYHGHMCISFELLGMNLYEFQTKNNYRPYTILEIQNILCQLCQAVNFLHKNKIIHTDIKPHNIVFKNPNFAGRLEDNGDCIVELQDTRIKLIDFGQAVISSDGCVTAIVTTRPYRAPEIFIEMGWNQSCDAWSLGCTALEFYTASTVFVSRNDHEHMAMMECILGKLPARMRRNPRRFNFFDKDGNLISSQNRKRDFYSEVRKLNDYMLDTEQDTHRLFSLISELLTFDPDERLTMENALKHPFFGNNPLP